MKYLNTEDLERSAVVANSLMNRERGITGSNSYTKELRLDPLAFLKERLEKEERVNWLDLCCGTGRALIETAECLIKDSLSARVNLTGIDLAGMFYSYPKEFNFLSLLEVSINTWTPDIKYDLITCVHGLHYIGDKLDMINRAISWLNKDGLFITNLDLNNLKLEDGKPAGRGIISELRTSGINYDTRNRLLICKGRREINLNYDYLGANDNAGPNYTGQPAVDSYYHKRIGL